MNLTKAGEYAIAALSRLALQDPRRNGDSMSVPVRDLAKQQNIPASFLAKIMAQCAKAGIVEARRGPAGGVALSRPAWKITLLSIIEACEGDYRRRDCVFYADKPCTGPDCEIYCPLRRQEEALREELGKVTLADMSDSLRDHPFRWRRPEEKINGSGLSH